MQFSREIRHRAVFFRAGSNGRERSHKTQKEDDENYVHQVFAFCAPLRGNSFALASRMSLAIPLSLANGRKCKQPKCVFLSQPCLRPVSILPTSCLNPAYVLPQSWLGSGSQNAVKTGEIHDVSTSQRNFRRRRAASRSQLAFPQVSKLW
jgi:hypothetical protein